jgi:hypothetical protein
MAIHSRWVQETIQDYLSEMTEMIAISTKQGPDSGQRGR